MLSSYLVTKLRDKILRDIDFTVTTPYVSLHTASPATTGANEITAGSEGGSYARQPCSSWGVALPRTNAAVVEWTNTPFIEVSHFGLWDAVSGGNFLMGGTLMLSTTLGLGEHVRFAAGHLQVNCESRFSSYLQPKILDKILKNADFNVDAAYGSLHTSDPGLIGENEFTGSAARPLVDHANNPLSAPALSVNTWTVTYEVVSTNWEWQGLDNGTITHIGLWDSATYGAGNFLMSGVLTTPVTTTGGNSTVKLTFPDTAHDQAFFRFIQAP